MYPILGRFGPFFLYTYQYVWALGILGALALAYHLAARPRQWQAWFDPFLVGLIAGILGGRVAFVVVNWAYYQMELAEIWLVWRGGLGYHGALLAGLVAVWQWSNWRGPRWQLTANTLALLLPLLHLTGWTACFFHGCGYGRLASPGWLALNLPDSFGVFDLRYPTQLLGIGLSLLILLLVIWGKRRLPEQSAHALFWLALLLLTTSNLLIWPWRGDGQTMLGPLVDAGIAAAALIALIRFRPARQP